MTSRGWRYIDLRDADLRGWRTRGADLRHVDLRGADLRGARLREADLRRADLRRLNLSSALMVDADMREADLRGAVLASASLVRADLRGADLRGADLRDTDLCGADLREADWRDTVLAIAVLGPWTCYIQPGWLTVRCERRRLEDWESMSDRELEELAPGAAAWRRRYGGVVQQIAHDLQGPLRGAGG